MESQRLRDLLAAADRWASRNASPEGSPAAVVLGLLRSEVARFGPGSPLVPPLADALSLYLARERFPESYGAAGTAADPPRRLDIEEARAWRSICLMEEQPSTRWTVETLAKAVGVSRAVFARDFTAIVGVPPLKFLARSRMETAAELLRDSPATLAEVGAAVGYDSEFAFSRAFSRHHGVPPSVFRTLPRESRAAIALALAA